MRIPPWAFVLCFAFACSAPDQPEPAGGDPTSADAGTSQPTPDAGMTTMQPSCVAGSTCLAQGENTFVNGNDTRAITVLLPAQAQGAPVVFAWHYLTGSRQELIAWMGLQQLADAGYLVVVPASRALSDTEWDVVGAPERNVDVALFDALLEAVTAQYNVDRTRIYATGFSAGGLFTTYLTMYRAQVLRATAPFSGGVPQGAYAAPATDLPVMISWGGTGDVLYGFDFNDAANNFARSLTADGHAVALCNHGQGHWLPSDALPHVLAFFGDHAADPGTAWSVDPARVPSGCVPAPGGR